MVYLGQVNLIVVFHILLKSLFYIKAICKLFFDRMQYPFSLLFFSSRLCGGCEKSTSRTKTSLRILDVTIPLSSLSKALRRPAVGLRYCPVIPAGCRWVRMDGTRYFKNELSPFSGSQNICFVGQTNSLKD